MPAQLKSLELQGYKTFANRTYFEFAERVTAIVGPNGSGKSNIADSIRWVLGEQSYSLLRARKTEDLIFSGSESRSRAGLASATITFDNSDSWLPIDFSEVAITRRAYRDGNNEYLINGQRVRLRDVSELLAESGLAERTYTVIGQGLVDAALSLKADERRRLFEEAAGIGLHRSRREEALRRLETTRRNLERVEDILAELKPRLSSLERQARRALEYEQVHTDLQLMLREWYGYHWSEAQKELAEALHADRVQESRLEKARQALQLDENQLAALRERIQSLRQALNEWQSQLAEHHTQREQALRSLAVIEARQHALEAQRQNDRDALFALDEELVFHHEQLQASGLELAALSAELDQASQQVLAARQSLEDRQGERSRLEGKLQAARQELADLNARRGQLEARLAENLAQEGRDRLALGEAEASLSAAEQELDAAESQQVEARQLLEAAERAAQQAEASLQEHQRRLQSLDQDISGLRERRAGLSAENARLKAQMDVLEQAEAALTGYASGTRLLLQAARQNRLPGARGSLNAFLEVPPHLEKAVAAALGDFLDAVVLQDDPETALDLLQTEAGRGVLLPVAAVRASRLRLKQFPANEDILGLASELVQYPADLEPVIKLLLGTAIIVRDRLAARRVIAGQPEGVRAVTLRGEVFHAAGPVQSGSADVGEDQTLLGRDRQKRAAAEGIRLALEQLASLDEKLSSRQAELQTLHQQGELLLQARESARQDLVRRTRLLDQARLAAEGAARQLRWRQDHQKGIQEGLAQRAQQASQLQAQLSELEAGLESARQSLRELGAALESLPLDEFQIQLSHWITRQAVAEQAYNDGRLRQQERQGALERAERARHTLNERLSGYDVTLPDLEDERSFARQAEAQVSEQIRQLNGLIEPGEEEFSDLEQEQVAQQRSADASRQQVSIAEHFHAQTRINLARRQEKLGSLQRRIEDDLGLVAFEYADQVSGPTPLPLQGLVEQLPVVRALPPEIEENIKRQRAQLRRMGPVNPEARAEYKEVKERFIFLTEQVADLHHAEQDVREVIAELDELMRNEFRRTFDAVADEFHHIFTRLFGGGSARLLLTDPDDLTASGIEIEARLPGRRMQGLALLSGGERSLTAASLVFALLKVSPTPFCLLDEVDAMLDEANIGRFRELLGELSQQTQFVIVTHNRNTVQVADVIYGVTMGRDSTSQVLSLKLDEVGQVIE